MSTPSPVAPDANGLPHRWQRYPKYKPSGVEWLGEVPEGWNLNKLKYLASIRGRIGWRTLTTEDYVDEGPILLGVRNILSDGRLSLEGLTYIPIEKYDESPEIKVQENDVLLAKTGATIGKSCVVPKNDNHLTVNAAVNILRPKDDVVPSFLNYLISAAPLQHQMFMNIAFNARGNLFQDNISNIYGLSASFPEQSAISAFLDRETARIDTLIKKKKKQIELLQEKRSALISHAVTKGLDPSVPMTESGVEWLGMVPKHWRLDQLRRVIFKFVDYRGKTPEKVESGRILVTARNIKNNQIDFSLSEEFMREEDYDAWMVRGFPEIGDVLVTTEAPLGEVAQINDVNIALAQRIILLKARKSEILNEFLKYQLISDFGKGELRSRATGSTALGIKAEHLRSILCVVPPLDEQESIVQYIDEKCKLLETPVDQITKSINLLREYRSALISAAVTGKIDVRQEARA